MPCNGYDRPKLRPESSASGPNSKYVCRSGFSAVGQATHLSGVFVVIITVVDPIQGKGALIQIVGRQMRIAKGHLDGLVAQKGLNPAQIYARLHKSGGAGMAQYVGHNMFIGR